VIKVNVNLANPLTSVLIAAVDWKEKDVVVGLVTLPLKVNSEHWLRNGTSYLFHNSIASHFYILSCMELTRSQSWLSTCHSLL